MLPFRFRFICTTVVKQTNENEICFFSTGAGPTAVSGNTGKTCNEENAGGAQNFGTRLDSERNTRTFRAHFLRYVERKLSRDANCEKNSVERHRASAARHRDASLRHLTQFKCLDLISI